MARDLVGKGDPLVTLRLAWGLAAPGKRGPKAKLALGDVVTTAVALADREGIGALTTRRVAEELGISPMSIYTYVPGRYELLDLMADAVFGELRPPRGKTWRTKLEDVARQNWDLALRHPWLLDTMTHRPFIGPKMLAKYDAELSAVDGIGLTELEMDKALSLVLDYTWGAVRGAAREALVKQETGMTDQEWWAKLAPGLEEVFTAEVATRMPVASRVGPIVGEAIGAHDPPGYFAFGLACVLDGLEQLVARRSKKRPSPARRVR